MVGEEVGVQRGDSCCADRWRRIGVHSFPDPPLTDSTDRTLQHEETNLFLLHIIIYYIY
jgi:hypothetical protein